MFDPSWVGRSPLDQHDIESAGLIGPMPLRQILRGQFRQLHPLAMIHRQQSTAEGFRGPTLDLDKDHHTMVFRHEVQFAERGPYVAIENSIALGQQELFGLHFAGLAELMARVGSGHAITVRTMWSSSV